jgi:MFS family permease
MKKSLSDSSKDRIRKSLVYSLFDGIAFSVMFGMSDSFFQAYGIRLGAGDIQLGLMKTLPLTLGALSQLFSGVFISLFKSRRKFVSASALVQAVIFIPIILVIFMGPLRVPVLIAAVTVSSICSMILVPAWNSWMGDLVDQKTRGAWFGRRQSITGIVAFLSLLLAGFILWQCEQSAPIEFLGFIIIFAIALCGRLVSAAFLRKQYDPPYDHAQKRTINIKDFVSKSKLSNVGMLILYLSILNFALMMVAPYVDVFFLKGLKLDYITFTFASATVLGVKYLFMPVWGRACDSYGPRKVLLVGGVLISIAPVLWVFGNSLPSIFIIQTIAGFSWAAFEMATLNFLFDATTQQNRASSIAVYNVANGLIGLLGSLAGGFLIVHNSLFWSPYLIVFVASGVIRLLLTFVFAPRLKEVRSVKHIPAHLLPLRVLAMMTAQGLVIGLSLLAKIRNTGKRKISNKKGKD